MASAVGSKKGILGKGWLLAVGHALEKDGTCVREPTELLVRSNAAKAWLGGVELCGKAACGRGTDGSGRPGTACGERGSLTGTVAAGKAMWRAVFWVKLGGSVDVGFEGDQPGHREVVRKLSQGAGRVPAGAGRVRG